MKKYRNLIFPAVLLFFLSITARSAETIQNHHTPYVFPVTPGSSEWKSLSSREEMLDACQIPEDRLASMTTEALLETVLHYPLILDFMAFNSYKSAYKVMSDNFNGFRELFSREDAHTVILSYDLQKQDSLAENTDPANPADFFRPEIIRYLHACSEIKNGAPADFTTGVTAYEQICE